jgi:hypothetical protein
MMHRNHESDKNSAMITDIKFGLIWEANLEKKNLKLTWIFN